MDEALTAQRSTSPYLFIKVSFLLGALTEKEMESGKCPLTFVFGFDADEKLPQKVCIRCREISTA